MKKPYLFDIVVGYGCNFRCKYCFEQYGDTPYKDLAMSREVLSLACKYARHQLSCIPSDADMRVCFFGGEPLLYTDNINYAVESLADTKLLYNIITNGSLIQENQDFLLNLKSTVGRKLLINVSYDYSEQEKNRDAGSYETVRNGIRFLLENGFNMRTITVVSADNIDKLPEIVADHTLLKKEYPALRSVLNLNNESFRSLSYEDDVLPKLQGIAELNKSTTGRSFIRNEACGLRGTRFPGNIFGRLHAGVDVNGDIYPGYSFCFDREAVKNACYLGSVYDDFATLDTYRETLINDLPSYIGAKCLSCDVKCSHTPWRTIETNIGEFNATPGDTLCKLNTFLRTNL